MSTFDSQSVWAGDVVVKYTRYGDANLDGTRDINDMETLNYGKKMKGGS